MERTAVSGRVISRQQIRIEPHVRCAPRVRVIRQAYKLRVRQSRNELLNGGTLDLSAKSNDQVGLAAHRVPQARQSVGSSASHSQRCWCGVAVGEKRYESRFIADLR